MEKQPYIRFNFNSITSGRIINADQVVTIIRTQLTADNMFKGCRLPPVRALAHQLGLSKNTIQSAYDELKAQGLIESKDRSGFFVAEGSNPQWVQSVSLVPEPILKKINYLVGYKPNKNNNLMLSSVFIDHRLLPKEKLTTCFKSVLRQPGLPDINDYQGLYPLREKIADRLRDRGIDADADYIIITNGSQQGIDLVTRTLQTNVIATEDPSYWLGKYLFEMNNIKTIGLPIDPFSGINESEWISKLSQNKPGLVYLTTNFQNPNGYSYTSQELSKIIKWSQEFNFGILEDDWGSEMLSYSEFKPGLRAQGGKNVLYLNSFTKKLLPSLRIGYIAANEKTIEPLLMAKRASTSATPGIIESVLFEFLDRGYYDTHLRSVQEELDLRYEHCISLLRDLMPDEVKWTSPGGGPILWLEIPKMINLQILSQNLKDQGIIIQLSDIAYFNKPQSHGFKIGFAFLSSSEMEVAIDKTAKEIKRLMNV